MDLFATATKVTIGDVTIAKFWESSWLEGSRPKDIAPKIFEISRKKGATVSKAIGDNAWVTHIDTQQGMTLEHIQQFTMLWGMIANVTIHPGVNDSIMWKLTNGGTYTNSAYKAQFAGLVRSNMQAMVWKVWAP